MNKAHCIIIFVVLKAGLAYAQFTDSLRIVAGTAAIQSTNDHQPLWLASNRYGTIADRGNDLVSHIGLFNRHVLVTCNKVHCPNSAYKPKEIFVEYGADVYNNNHLNDLFFKEAYLAVGYMNWVGRAGRFKEITGEVDPHLSSGSLGISGNSLPIPKVQVAVIDYTPVPLTQGHLQFKGVFGHGWMGRNRYMQDAFLHEKSFYLRLGKGKLKLLGGVQHYVVWGGRREDWLTLDRSGKGFLNVVLARKADDGSFMDKKVKDGTVDQDIPKGYLPIRAGDHRGVVEGGMEWENRDLRLRIYHQTPFDQLHGLKIRNIDRLLGISIEGKQWVVMQKMVFELIHTKQMDDFSPPNIRTSYYNDGVYKTGWEYEDRIIGTPLFTNRVRGSKYFPGIVPYDWNAPHNEIGSLSNIINNRIIGGHMGFLLRPRRGIQTKTLMTFTRNYGTHAPHGPFVPPLNQVYTLQEISCQSHIPRLRYTGALGFDYGGMTKNVGVMAGLEYLVFMR